MWQRTGLLVASCAWGFVACGGGGAGDKGGGSPASNCSIEASNYDESCSVDSDCVGMAGRFAVQFGNYCQSGCVCGGDAINQMSVAKYLHDVSMTPLVSSMSSCFCPEVSTEACCVNNLCTTTSCGSVDAGDGASPAEPPGSSMCSVDVGPFEAGMNPEGAWQWCTPPDSCVPFNRGWACCNSAEGGVTDGPTGCSVPGESEGG